MVINSKAKVSGSIPENFVEVAEVMELYRSGALELNQETSQDFQELVIQPLKSKVMSYCLEFDMVSNSYIKNNSVLSKMRNSIMSPKREERAKKIEGITNKSLTEGKKTTQQMIQTMQKGHSLLLEIREALIGSKISTKFIITIDDKTYSIDEKFLSPYLTLSTYGGKTISNTFSLDYKIDRELLQSKEFLENSELISDEEGTWQHIFSLKPNYLKQKSLETGRQYPNIFYDAKDAEIYEYLIQRQGELSKFGDFEYAQLRKRLGGGGGNASPFYKTGDIGNIQVKYFKIKKGQRDATVNFARFSLLRDRFQQLYDILDKNNIQEIGKELSKFFTEEEYNISEEITRQTNREIQQIFNKIFNL